MKENFGPLWQLKQSLDHYEKLALAHGRDAQAYLAKQADATRCADEYRAIIEKLEQDGQ